MKGLVYIKCNADRSYKSSVDKFYAEDKLKAIAEFSSAQPGDLILILAGQEARTRKAISELRLEMAERLGLRKKDEFRLLWVLDFPLFEYAEDDTGSGQAGLPTGQAGPPTGQAGRCGPRHHPITAPKPDHSEMVISNNPVIENAAEYLSRPYASIKANAYDMVLSGNESGGGSIRMFERGRQ